MFRYVPKLILSDLFRCGNNNGHNSLENKLTHNVGYAINFIRVFLSYCAVSLNESSSLQALEHSNEMMFPDNDLGSQEFFHPSTAWGEFSHVFFIYLFFLFVLQHLNHWENATI